MYALVCVWVGVVCVSASAHFAVAAKMTVQRENRSLASFIHHPQNVCCLFATIAGSIRCFKGKKAPARTRDDTRGRRAWSLWARQAAAALPLSRQETAHGSHYASSRQQRHKVTGSSVCMGTRDGSAWHYSIPGRPARPLLCPFMGASTLDVNKGRQAGNRTFKAHPSSNQLVKKKEWYD